MSQLLPNVTIRKKTENRDHLPASASPMLGGKSDAGDWGALRLPVLAAWWHTMPLGRLYSRGDTQATQGLSCFSQAQHPKPCSLGQVFQSAVA